MQDPRTKIQRNEVATVIDRIYDELLLNKEFSQLVDEGFTREVVEDIVMYQFKFAKEKMSEGEKNNWESFNKTIWLQHLGSFVASKYMVNKFKKITENKLMINESTDKS